jgi:2,4-dienoyl-CoA reductase-like NADH-dependent reductase (Old Yellow Enzyme family)
MPRDPRYDILFTPIRIGPVTAKNRFFQVPHCNGMGHAMPLAHAAMREMKAEGGWAVVSTEECEIHPSSDLTPYVEARLWDDRDIPALALMCDKVHAHGALAALELVPTRMQRFRITEASPKDARWLATTLGRTGKPLGTSVAIDGQRLSLTW